MKLNKRNESWQVYKIFHDFMHWRSEGMLFNGGGGGWKGSSLNPRYGMNYLRWRLVY